MLAGLDCVDDPRLDADLLIDVINLNIHRLDCRIVTDSPIIDFGQQTLFLKNVC